MKAHQVLRWQCDSCGLSYEANERGQQAAEACCNRCRDCGGAASRGQVRCVGCQLIDDVRFAVASLEYAASDLEKALANLKRHNPRVVRAAIAEGLAAWRPRRAKLTPIVRRRRA